MKKRILLQPLPALALLGVMCAAILAPGSARAQGSAVEEAGRKPIVTGTGERKSPRNDAPPGLPGTQVNKDRVIPAEHSAADMPPTEALFDAVNRGDIAAARDAIARGADFNGRNELGLTPLDEAIDLSRNDITFMLLSLRGAFGEPSAPPQVLGSAAPKGGSKSGGTSATPVAARATAKPQPVAKPATPAPAPSTGQLAGPGPAGTPDPKSGFLGFGG